MTLITDIRKNVSESTPVQAVVGATDLAVERVRAAAASASHLPDEVEKTIHQLETVPAAVQARMKKIDTKAVQQSLQQAPALALTRALDAAGRVEESYEKLAERVEESYEKLAERVEESYEKLAERGKELLERMREQKATQDLVKQSKVTVSRTRAAVTTARKAVDDTATAARGVVGIGRREAGDAVSAVEAPQAESVAETKKVVKARTGSTRAAVTGAATTVRKRAVATRSAATSVRKSPAKAGDAPAPAPAEAPEVPTAEG